MARGELKQSTSVKVVVGPIVGATSASSPGITPITNLSLASADEAEIIKHNATGTISATGNTFVAIANADGYYNLTFTASNTNTLGNLAFLVNDDSLSLPFRQDFQVVSAPYWNFKYGASGSNTVGDVVWAATSARELSTATGIWSATSRTLTSATNLTVNLVNTVTTLTNKTGFALSATAITDVEQGVWGASGTRSLTTATNLTVNDLTTKTGFSLSAPGVTAVEQGVWGASGTRALTTATNLTVNLVNTVTTLTNKTGFALSATAITDVEQGVWGASGTRSLTTATNLTVLDVTNGVSIQAGGFPVGGYAAGAITDAAIAAGAENQIAKTCADWVVESKGSYSQQQALSIILAAVAGQSASGGAKLYNPTGGTLRIAGVVSATANERTSITLTPST